MIGSNDRPDDFVIGNCKAIINYGITEKTDGDGNVSYTYEAIEYPATDMVVLERAKAKLEQQYAKELKMRNIEKLIVAINGIDFDAHTKARSDMTGVVALANYEFNKALTAAMPELQPVYDAIYGSSVGWKGADNLTYNVQIKDISVAGTSAMMKYAEAIGAGNGNIES